MNFITAEEAREKFNIQKVKCEIERLICEAMKSRNAIDFDIGHLSEDNVSQLKNHLCGLGYEVKVVVFFKWIRISW